MLQQIHAILQLARWHKPIGFWLLGWPTFIALWIASEGKPSWREVLIFGAGVIVMRSLGCAINDLVDRPFDGAVARTASRVLVAGKLSVRTAVLSIVGWSLLAIGLLSLLPMLAWPWGIVGAGVTLLYPWCKRFFWVPQAILGIAFSMAIPIVFVTVQGYVPTIGWVLWLANVLWTIAYDTEYAMADAAEDANLPIYSSALTFGRYVVPITLALLIAAHLMFFVLLKMLGAPKLSYGIGLLGLIDIGYQYTLIRSGDPARCFKAFLHNVWFGGLWAGAVLMVRF